MGSGGSSGSDTQTQFIRYAPYLETKHQTMLDTSEAQMTALIDDDAYEDAAASRIDYSDGLFGDGYDVSSFPSLYDMFGKFMAGVDVEALWHQVLEDVVDNDTVSEMSSAHKALLDDELESNVLPRFQAGMRDMNAVMSSTFIIGKSLLEEANNKQLAVFDADARYKLIPVAADVFSKHMAWNQGMIGAYSEVIKLAFLIESDSKEINTNYAVKSKLWPFTVLNYHRDIVSALNGPRSSTTETAGGPSGTQKALSGALGGAAMGASVGGAPGAVIGGAVGLAASFF